MFETEEVEGWDTEKGAGDGEFVEDVVAVEGVGDFGEVGSC